MTPEEREHFDAFVKGMMLDLAPVNTHETFLANSMAEEAWRLNQIRARCANLAAVGDLDGAGDNYRPMEAETAGIESAVIDSVVARDHSKELALMSLYAQRTQRAYEKYRKELNELQQNRKADHAAQLEESPPTSSNFSRYTGLNPHYDPRKDAKQDGIVFSLPFIKAQPTTERHSPPPHPCEKDRIRLPQEAQLNRNHPNSRQSSLTRQATTPPSPFTSRFPPH